MKPLPELISQVSALIVEISEHPDFQSLVTKGCEAALSLDDAYTAIVYLLREVVLPPLDDLEVEVK